MSPALDALHNRLHTQSALQAWEATGKARRCSSSFFLDSGTAEQELCRESCSFCVQAFERLTAEQGTEDNDEEGHVSIRLPHVTSGDLIMFPETAEGYVSKVRFSVTAGDDSVESQCAPCDRLFWHGSIKHFVATTRM